MLSEVELARLARDVIDELYDAVFDASAWRRVVRMIGATAPELRPVLTVEEWPLSSRIFESANVDPEMLKRYLAEFVDENIFRPTVAYVRRHKVALSTDYIAQEEVVRTRFHADLWRPHADVRAVSANVMGHDGRKLAVLAFHYDYAEQSRSLPAGMRLHRMMGPHAERAFALAVRGASLAQEARAGDLISALAIPAMVLDRTGRLIRANPAAEAVLCEARLLSLSAAGMLRSGRLAGGAAVEDGVARAIATRRPVVLTLAVPDGPGPELTVAPVARRDSNDAIYEVFVARAEPAAIVYLNAP